MTSTSKADQLCSIVDDIHERYDPLIDEFNEFKAQSAAGVEYPITYLGDLYHKFRELYPWLVSAGESLANLEEYAAEGDVERMYHVLSQISDTTDEVREAKQLRWNEWEERQDKWLKEYDEDLKRLDTKWNERLTKVLEDDDSDDSSDSEDEDSDDEDETETLNHYEEKVPSYRDEMVDANNERKALETVAGAMQKQNSSYSPCFSSEMAAKQEHCTAILHAC